MKSANYSERDQVRKALLLIIDQVIDTGESDGTLLTVLEYAEAISKLALSVISVFDTTGLASLAETFIEPICGPTSFIGVVDNGNMTTALGLTTSGKAFAGSYGTWTKTGDGVVKITLVSSDTKDVTVNVHSGGDKIASVKVKSGKTVLVGYSDCKSLAYVTIRVTAVRRLVPHLMPLATALLAVEMLLNTPVVAAVNATSATDAILVMISDVQSPLCGRHSMPHLTG